MDKPWIVTCDHGDDEEITAIATRVLNCKALTPEIKDQIVRLLGFTPVEVIH